MLRFVKRYYWIGFLFLLSCDKPKAPSFTANLQIPLFKKNYTYLDMKVNHDSLHVRGDSVFAFIDTTENFKVEDNLKANPTTATTAGTIRNDLRVRDSVTTNYSLGLLGPGGVDALNGTNATIPPFAIPNTTRNISYPTFTATTIYSGTLRTVITNNTHAKMDSLFVVIFNSSNGTRIDSFKISNLLDATTQTFSKSFAAPLNVITPVSVRLNGGSSGSGSPVAVDTSRGVSVKAVFDVSASSVTGLFPAQTIVRNDSAQSTSNSAIDSAVIKSGKIDFTVTRKSLAVNSTVTITSSDFLKPSGASLDTFITMPFSGTKLTKSLNLSGYKFRPSGFDVGSGRQYARYTATIVMAAPGVSTTIANDQGDTVKATIDTLKFARVDGKLNNEDVNISPRNKKIDIKYLDSIQFKTAYFLITTEHKIQFPATLNLAISGKRNSTTVSLPPILGSMKAYLGGPDPQRDTIYASAGVAGLLSLVPDSLKFSGTAVVGDGVKKGSILSTDSVIVRVSLRAPLIFKLPDDSTKNVIKPSPTKIGMDTTVKKNLHDRLYGVTITAKLKNHFPVPVSFQLFINDDSNTVRFYDSSSAVKFVYPYTPVTINKATTDPVTGVVTASNDTTLIYTLTPDEYQKIFTPGVTIYRGLKARLLGTGSGWVQISTQDFLDVNADIDVEFFIDQNIGK